jgi:hypothetical protein
VDAPGRFNNENTGGKGMSNEANKDSVLNEQPTIALLIRRRELMPDGSLGAVFIGEFGGDRAKDLRLTFAQANTLVQMLKKGGIEG